MFLIANVFFGKVRTFCRLQVIYESTREKKSVELCFPYISKNLISVETQAKPSMKLNKVRLINNLNKNFTFIFQVAIKAVHTKVPFSLPLKLPSFPLLYS